jgi:hypothetical protein
MKCALLAALVIAVAGSREKSHGEEQVLMNVNGIVANETSPDEPRLERAIKERYSETVRNSLLTEAQKQASVLYTHENEQWEFIYSFFKGYVYAMQDERWEITIGDGKGPHQAGFDSGTILYEMRLGTGSQNLSMEDIGFEALTVEGKYRSEFEVSDFRPKGSSEKWWLLFRGNVLEDWAAKRGRLVARDSVFAKWTRCRFRGYIGPTEDFGVGHFNMYDRKFLVTEILEVKLRLPTQVMLVGTVTALFILCVSALCITRKLRGSKKLP